MISPRLCNAAALGGYFGLAAVLLLWYAWLVPPRYLPAPFVLAILLGPLLLPLPGLLRGRLYTHAWTGFLALPYFAHGVGEAYAGGPQRPYALLEIAFSVVLFLGAVLYVRQRTRASAAARGEAARGQAAVSARDASAKR